MPPPAPTFWKKVDENQLSYFMYALYPIATCVAGPQLTISQCQGANSYNVLKVKIVDVSQFKPGSLHESQLYSHHQ